MNQAELIRHEEELGPEFVEQVLDSRHGLQIEGHEKAVENLPVRIHAVRAIGAKTFVLGRIALGVLPFDKAEDFPAVVGFVKDRRVSTTPDFFREFPIAKSLISIEDQGSNTNLMSIK